MAVDIEQTDIFAKWTQELRDKRAKAIIAARLDRVSSGNLGDVKSLGNGLNELRIAFGPGYRIYFCWRGSEMILLLAGGDKSSQSRDIAKARKIMTEIS